MRRERAPWRRAVAVSTVLHLAVLGGLYAMRSPPPAPPKTPPDPLEGVEVVLLESVPEVPAPVLVPTEAAPAEVEPPPEESGSSPPEPSSPALPSRPAARDSGGDGGDAPSPEGSVPVSPSPSGGGLALSGLRGSSRAPAPSGPPPPPTVASPSAPKPRPKPSPALPSLGPRARVDREPRSFEEAGFKKRKDGSYKKGKISEPFVVIIEPNGRVRFRDRVAMVNGLAIKPNLLPPQKLAGEAQFRNEKVRILRETAALREALARGWVKKQMNRELARLDAKLKRVWERPDWTVVRRRKQLFLLWDECEEPLDTNDAAKSVDDVLDASRREIGAKARATIVAFINDELPSGSDDAYPKTELASLNRGRHSRARFEPYR